uniref:Eukaryotic translation initiation factor 2-alpha kinase-like n=1 Tax=Nicotiana sylvestris TaxID=4096 RepID=A0A1U7W159_NICSY|nr:PREDICTED: eukaryotic translation initiation factor 2-alpha kinase-like [Nicotiana sylvestris]
MVGGKFEVELGQLKYFVAVITSHAVGRPQVRCSQKRKAAADAAKKKIIRNHRSGEVGTPTVAHVIRLQKREKDRRSRCFLVSSCAGRCCGDSSSLNMTSGDEIFGDKVIDEDAWLTENFYSLSFWTCHDLNSGWSEFEYGNKDVNSDTVLELGHVGPHSKHFSTLCFDDDIEIESSEPLEESMEEEQAAYILGFVVPEKKNYIPYIKAEKYRLLIGISYVHSKGFIYCDMKPSNVLVFLIIDHEYDSIVEVCLKLTDFGLSLRVVENETHTYWDRGSKKCCYNRGALLYASPESTACKIHGKAVDIWAIGCIVVEMITGRWLSSCCEGIDDLDFKITHEEPVISSNVSNICKDFLAKCFEMDHSWRWTADMLLSQPFIKSGTFSKYHPEDHGLITNKVILNPFSHGRRSWVSKQHWYSTCFHVPSSDNLRPGYAIFPAEKAQFSQLACN